MKGSQHLNQPGDTYQNFRLKTISSIEELQCILREVEHIPTSAKIVHIAAEDLENVFCLGFKTYPNDSTGVAHILEHTVFCGSKKYPLKDVFFSMNRRSLNTYMNALTGPDFTYYPAASQNQKDFYNLLSVYLDSVFHPKLDRLSFMQEGHRYELANPKDIHSSLTSKGIVYNEMKGSLSSPITRIWDHMMSLIYPDIVYHHNSGGIPQEIPQLTYENFVRFHQTYYQPSNCFFYFYGNIELDQHLDFLNEHLLSQAKKSEPIPDIPLQNRFKKPLKEEISYPAAHNQTGKDNTYLALGWLTCHLKNQEEVLALSVLDNILMGNDASPLKLKLLASNYCKNVYGMLDEEMSELPYLMVFEGCNPEKVSDIQSIIHKTLQELIDKGIDPQLIEAAFHQIEFYRSEITGDHYPFGLQLFFRIAHLVQHGGNPENGLKIHTLFDNLRQKIQNPQYLNNLIKTYFLENSHFITLIAKPDPSLTQKEAAEELTRLQNHQKSLSEDELQKIAKDHELFVEMQLSKQEESVDSLPKIYLKDVDKNIRSYPLEKTTHEHFTNYFYEGFTNEIFYLDFKFPLASFSLEELPYVRLLTHIWSQIGRANKTYIQNLEDIQLYTGGISASIDLHCQAEDFHIYKPAITIHGKALSRNVPHLFEIILELIISPKINDPKRIKELITQHFADLDTELLQNPMRYASLLAASSISPSSFLVNSWYGLDYYYFMKKLSHQIDQKIATVIETLSSLQQKLFLTSPFDTIISCDEKNFKTVIEHNFYGLDGLAFASHPLWENKLSIPKINSQGIAIHSPVAFTSTCFESIPYVHEDLHALNIAATLADNLILTPNVREKYGAYGSGANNHSSVGKFYFYAYRDPNLATTLDFFRQSIEHVAKGHFSQEDLEEAKLSIFQRLDSPISPGLKGYYAYCWLRENKTDKLRQQQRDRLFNITAKDVQVAAEKHLLPKLSKATTVSFANRDFLEKENAKLSSYNLPPLDLKNI